MAQISEEEIAAALALIRAAGRGDLLAEEPAGQSMGSGSRPVRAASAGVAAAVLACRSDREGAARLGGEKEKGGGKGTGREGGKGKGPAKKQRTESDLGRTERVLGAVGIMERDTNREEGELGSSDEELVRVMGDEEMVRAMGLIVEQGPTVLQKQTGWQERAGGQGGNKKRPTLIPIFLPEPVRREEGADAGFEQSVRKSAPHALPSRSGQQEDPERVVSGEMMKAVAGVWEGMLKKKELEWDERLQKQWASGERELELFKLKRRDVSKMWESDVGKYKQGTGARTKEGPQEGEGKKAMSIVDTLKQKKGKRHERCGGK